MLRAEHIMRLKLDRDRLLAHRQMPPPKYSTKELTNQITAIGDAVIAELLDVPASTFAMQLEAARSFGTSYLMEDQERRIVGISAATSLIKSGDIIRKNVIMPRNYAWKNDNLSKHYIIGVFVRGRLEDGVIPDIAEVEVAGWTDTGHLRAVTRGQQDKVLPKTFQSKLPVAILPCTDLRPIDTLVNWLNANDVCV